MKSKLAAAEHALASRFRETKKQQLKISCCQIILYKVQAGIELHKLTNLVCQLFILPKIISTTLVYVTIILLVSRSS